MMRIAIDCRYIRERPSGIGAYVAALVQRLPELAPDFQFQLWTHRLAPCPLSDAANAIERCVTPEPNSVWSLWWPRRYADFAGIDLLHAPHNTLPRGVPCPSVVTIHDLMTIERPDLAFTRASQRIKRWYYPAAVRRALREASRLIVTTSATAARVADLYPPANQRVRVIPLAAASQFRPAADPGFAAACAATLIGSDAPFVLVVGQDAPNKRHAVALQAFAAGAPKQWRLVLVQRQRHGGALEMLARRLGVAGRVTWLPAIAGEELAMLYQSARALLQPSDYEGFGLPALEAMSCGCPVIASDIATLREVIGSGGVLVPVMEIARFGRAIATLATSTTMENELRGTAIARSESYSWHRCATETLAVYREVLNA